MKFIKLRGKYGEIVDNWAVVDDEDYEKVSKYKWYASKESKSFYATVHYDKPGEKRKLLKMHRLIMNIQDSKVFVDHKDRNGLNNQKDNLRTCNVSENASNKLTEGGKYSKYKGVGCDTIKGKVYWKASVIKYGKVYRVRCKTEKLAAIKYNELALKHHGEFACLNIIEDESNSI